MTEANASRGFGWRAKLLIAFGILAVVLPILCLLVVIIGLRAHLPEDCRVLHLRNISVRCREYAAAHNGQFPAKWSDLEWDGMGGITTFVCPSVGHGVGDWKQIDLWSDYRLIPGRTTNDSADTVLAIEPLSNQQTGANVLFVDGSLAWWPLLKVKGQKWAVCDDGIVESGDPP